LLLQLPLQLPLQLRLPLHLRLPLPFSCRRLSSCLSSRRDLRLPLQLRLPCSCRAVAVAVAFAVACPFVCHPVGTCGCRCCCCCCPQPPQKTSSRPKAAHFAAAVERPPYFVFACSLQSITDKRVPHLRRAFAPKVGIQPLPALFFFPTQPNKRHLDRNCSKFHRKQNTGEIPVFRLCRRLCSPTHPKSDAIAARKKCGQMTNAFPSSKSILRRLSITIAIILIKKIAPTVSSRTS
jgi:hypothetical protein